MSLRVGTRLGPYEILSPLGAGGMGEVYRARDTRLAREVAIKLLHTSVTADADRLRRFEQEARAAGALNHPNILTVHDVGTHQAAPYLVTELLEGETLRERLAASALAAREAAGIALQIASGLAAAHEKGIVHRDIKPENLFLTREGRVKILDFGLAKLVPVPRDPGTEPTATVAGAALVGATQPGMVMGTAAYMSPEQVRGLAVDFRSDIFSFGLVLYEMASGRPAFARGTVADTMAAILTEEPMARPSPAGDFPPGWERIVRRCLEKAPERRFPSARDVARALEALAEEAAGPAARAGAATKSIVVLPFANLSADPADEYFSDGLTEEIITDLAGVGSLRVISRTSAMRLKGAARDLAAIAGDLGVQYVLEGSVRRAGQNLRITAQLIDAANDAHLWAEKYNGTLDDVFDIQERVSRAIVAALEIRLTPQEARRMGERPIESVYVWECYLKARREIMRFDREALERARGHLEEGLRVVGENALLLAGMGYLHWQYANLGLAQEESVREAEACVQRALELDPDSPIAHRVLAVIASQLHGDQQTAVRHFKKALAADPNDPDSLLWLSTIYLFAGRTDQAEPLFQRLLEVDPLTPVNQLFAAFRHSLEGNFALAREAGRKVYEMNRDDRMTSIMHATVLLPIAPEEARPILEETERQGPASVWDGLVLSLWHALEGRREAALRYLTPALQATAARDVQASGMLADTYALLGEKGEALRWLENAVDRGFINYAYLARHDPFLANLRDDERFLRLMERVKREAERFEA